MLASSVVKNLAHSLLNKLHKKDNNMSQSIQQRIEGKQET